MPPIIHLEDELSSNGSAKCARCSDDFKEHYTTYGGTRMGCSVRHAYGNQFDPYYSACSCTGFAETIKRDVNGNPVQQ